MHAVTGLGSRRWWLPVIGLLLAVALGMLAYAQLAAPTTSLQSPGSAKSIVGGDTARRAFAPAAELAARWQQDARLAGVSGQQLAIGKGTEIEWGFQFFSPSTQQLALVAVSGGQARMVRPPAPSPYTVPTFSPEEWRVDSDQALQGWWERGGSSLVTQHAQVDLVMQLRMPADPESPQENGSHPVWTVVGAAAGTNTTLTILVDASDGTAVDLR